MRIGMMADAYKPHVSGVTHHISLNKRALEEGGDTVYVFTLGYASYKDDEPHVVRTPAIPLGGTGFSLGFRHSAEAQRKLATMDIVHVHHPFLSGQLALRYCRARGVPVVFTHHTRYDLYARAYLPFVPSHVSTALLGRYMMGFCRECDLVIAPTPSLFKVLHWLKVESPVEVIPNGVNLLPFQQASRRRQRAEFGLSDSDRVLIYVGRMGPEKNVDFLLRAFALARRADEGLRLVLVGGGPKRGPLCAVADRLGIAESVRFLGGVPYSDLPSLLGLADAFVTASITEVHPLSLIEAMAAGLPAVGIASPGIADTIRDGENGFLSANDLDSLAANMLQLFSDAAHFRRLAANAREDSRQYDICRTSQMVRAQYERLVEARQRAA